MSKDKSPDCGAGAPEVTEAMIQAGADTLGGFLIEDASEGHTSDADRREVAEMVLRAALGLALPKTVKSGDVVGP